MLANAIKGQSVKPLHFHLCDSMQSRLQMEYQIAGVLIPTDRAATEVLSPFYCVAKSVSESAGTALE